MSIPDPNVLISAASGAGGVVVAALLLLARRDQKTKDIARTIVLEHQTDCPVAAQLREESITYREETMKRIDSLGREVRDGMFNVNGRLDRIFDRLGGRL